MKFGKYDGDITYLHAIRKAGGKVNRPVVQGAALGIMREKAPHLQPGKKVKAAQVPSKAAKKVPADAPEQHRRCP